MAQHLVKIGQWESTSEQLGQLLDHGRMNNIEQMSQLLYNGGMSHESYMYRALAEAARAEREGEVPVGAIIVYQDQIVASAYNQREQLRDPTAHAEMIAITQAAEYLQSWRLLECRMYVTLEPCPMCAGAILQARIPELVFGAFDPKAGAVTSLYQLLADSRLNHRTTTMGGILADECGAILSRFFAAQREARKEQLGKE